MANEKPNKVVLGSQTIIDLTGDTVVADKLIQGYTAHKADGSIITGTAQAAKEEQTKAVTALTSVINVLPDSGKVLSKVTVNPQVHSDYFELFEYLWTSESTLPYNVRSTVAVLYNNEIHILGGSSNQTAHYKWNGSSWTSVSTLPYNFLYASAVVYNNEIHILGGYSNITKHYKWNGSSWTSVSTLPYEFFSGSAVVLNNEIHILGSSSAPTNHYKWNGSSWTQVSTLPYNFIGGVAVVYNDEIHILGGNYSKNHYKWNGSSWTSVSTLPYDITYSSVIVYNNEIHLLGGSSSTRGHHKTSVSEFYLWISIGYLPYNFYNGSAVVYDNKIRILGGAGGLTNDYKSYKSLKTDMAAQHKYRYIVQDFIPSKVLLYENPSPTSAQAAGTITLTGPANVYDWLLIKFSDWTPGQGTEERYSLWPDPTIYKEPSSGAQFSFIAVGGYRGSSYGYARRLYFGKSDTDWTTMYMTTGQQMNRAGTNNNGCIIKAIYGVNNLPTDWLST